VATASVDAVGAEAGHAIDPARFRANVLLEGLPAFGEDALVGQRVRVGSALLEVTMRSPRCVMIDMESADLPAEHGNLLATGRANGACIGVIARVVEPGRISRGDAVVTASSASEPVAQK
jgi:MOSC domain-containing protein YiiM